MLVSWAESVCQHITSYQYLFNTSNYKCNVSFSLCTQLRFEPQIVTKRIQAWRLSVFTWLTAIWNNGGQYHPPNLIGHSEWQQKQTLAWTDEYRYTGDSNTVFFSKQYRSWKIRLTMWKRNCWSSMFWTVRYKTFLSELSLLSNLYLISAGKCLDRWGTL